MFQPELEHPALFFIQRFQWKVKERKDKQISLETYTKLQEVFNQLKYELQV
jgi:hypothetical protein